MSPNFKMELETKIMLSFARISIAFFFLLLWHQLGTMDHAAFLDRAEQGYASAADIAIGGVLPVTLILYILADRVGTIDFLTFVGIAAFFIVPKFYPR